VGSFARLFTTVRARIGTGKKRCAFSSMRPEYYAGCRLARTYDFMCPWSNHDRISILVFQGTTLPVPAPAPSLSNEKLKKEQVYCVQFCGVVVLVATSAESQEILYLCKEKTERGRDPNFHGSKEKMSSQSI
jgi:hypothetical protein